MKRSLRPTPEGEAGSDWNEEGYYDADEAYEDLEEWDEDGLGPSLPAGAARRLSRQAARDGGRKKKVKWNEDRNNF